MFRQRARKIGIINSNRNFIIYDRWDFIISDASNL